MNEKTSYERSIGILNGSLNNGHIKNSLLRYRVPFIFIFQLFVVIASYAISFLIRFDIEVPWAYMQIFYQTLPFLIVSRMLAYYYYRIHMGSWRFVSIQDLMDTMKAVLLGSVVFLVLMVFVFRLKEYPRSVFLLEAIINIMLVGGSRFVIRYYYENIRKENPKTLKDVLIAGAGKAGFIVLNEIRTNTSLGIRVVGFVDDDPFKRKTTIQGVPVLGTIGDIPALVKKHGVDEVIIAIPSAGYKDLMRINEIAQSADVRAKTLPGLGKMINGDGFTGQIRDVSCNDLLGRRTVIFSRESDKRLLREEITDKAVLVTGAGGSIGSELCRQVAQLHPRILILYERYENSLYELELELRKEYPELDLMPVVGDILDERKVERILRENGVNLIYHAAAYKHVPVMEREPLEAVRNNVLGTLNFTRKAVENKVEKFVLISTDKAVNPINIMGTTKRVAELIIQGLSGNGVQFVAVRFGNVIGSNGSVIPIFKKQIEEGGPVTVTHSDVTRYFMAIPEAVQLVMTAGAMGKGGEIFLLDMGKPIRITDLARDLIKRSGMEPGKDIDIVITGLRPGEKLTEELYWEGEGIIPTENKKITMLKPTNSCSGEILKKIETLRDKTDEGDVSGVLRILTEIAPEARIMPDA